MAPSDKRVDELHTSKVYLTSIGNIQDKVSQFYHIRDFKENSLVYKDHDGDWISLSNDFDCSSLSLLLANAESDSENG